MPLLRCPRDGAWEQRNETPRGCHARSALPSGSRSVGTLLMQSSFKAGDLEWSLPALAVANPVVSVIAGTVALHEHLSAAAGTLVTLPVSLAVALVGVVVLARSPALVAIYEEPDGELGAGLRSARR